MKSLFIVFDGLDGSGKGEMVERLEEHLVDKGIKVLVTKEPTDGRYGKQIRDILRKERDPRAGGELCLKLFVKDRGEHLKKEIEPFLKQDESVVVCDRYYYSTMAFQRTQGVDMEKLIIENMAFRTPDIAFILDLPVEIALERVEKRGKNKEKFEQPEFMGELRENFLKLGKELEDNIKIIDASKSKDEVFSQIKEEVDKII